jgi:predicted DNA-binding protein with PD1-like motif
LKNPDPLLSGIRALTVRLHPHDDVKQKLDELVQAQKMGAGCILSCVGSLEKAAIRFADQASVTTVEGKLEIVSLTGTLGTAGSHLHIAVSDRSGITFGGHLKEGALVYTTAEIVIGVLDGVVYDREVDPGYGFKELIVKAV